MTFYPFYMKHSEPITFNGITHTCHEPFIFIYFNLKQTYSNWQYCCMCQRCFNLSVTVVKFLNLSVNHPRLVRDQSVVRGEACNTQQRWPVKECRMRRQASITLIAGSLSPVIASGRVKAEHCRKSNKVCMHFSLPQYYPKLDSSLCMSLLLCGLLSLICILMLSFSHSILLLLSLPLSMHIVPY